jgi:chloramphenicol O-acetyltransferase
MFPGTNILKQRDALSSSLFNFAFVYAIMKVQEKQKGFKLNGTRQLPVYVDNVNIFGEKHAYCKEKYRGFSGCW